ncbi:MAG: radical SAM family heme chaperone HemW [Gemmatimonadaceae bacterium]|nr:radical SAM family heme chaperone HemW [Gemmatimonadaceae bacterium]
MTAATRVYVHVPFCARRCSYCDFSIAVRREVPVAEFLAALEAELRIRLPEARSPQPIDTLYFGGGTPSHLGPDGVARMMDLMRTRFSWSAGAEVTLEANPDDVSAHATAAWRRAGITRVSLGAQSFDPAVLEWMHRSHSAAQIDAAVERIREAEFDSWSFDLIFALPAALKRDWQRDLDLALGKEPPHLSLYGLTIEPGTPLARWSDRGDVLSADETAYEHEFLSAHAGATAVGFDHYEVSNFAQPGHHARHNRAYWQGVPYLGVGPSAHGFDGTRRRWNRAAYAAWRDAVAAGQDPIAGSEVIDADAERLEAVYLGLRTSAGLRVTERERELVGPWIEAGWARLEGQTVVLTPSGWLRLDGLASALTPVHGVR